MAYDIDKHVASLAGDHFRSLELSRRERFTTQRRSVARRQNQEDRVLDLARQAREYSRDQLAAFMRERPYLTNEYEASIAYVFSCDPDLYDRMRAEQLHLDAVGIENKPPTAAGPYPTAVRTTGIVEQEDYETRVRPEGVGRDLTPTRGGKPNVGRSSGNDGGLRTQDSIELATRDFEDRVADLMKTDPDYLGNYMKAAGEVARRDPELYARTQKSVSVKTMVG